MISHFRALIFLVVLSLFSCRENLEEKNAQGGKKYGGTFTFFSPENTTIFIPYYSPSVYNQRVLSQIFEPLFQIDDKGRIKSNLAKKFDLNRDGKIISITLRSNVFFQDDDCFSDDRRMTAEDVKFSLEFACSGNKWNSLAGLLRDKIVGGKEHYLATKNKTYRNGISGIKIINDTIIQLNLTDNFTNFQKLLAHPSLGILSKKAFEYYQHNMVNHPVGTGPFRLKAKRKDGFVLSRNPEYWKKDNFGNQLPFLSEIHVCNLNGINQEYSSFSKKEADIIFELPVGQLDFAFGSLRDAQNGKNLLHRVVLKKGSKINYLSFDCTSPPFNNALVRKAIGMAIDRKRICLDAMNGEGNYEINGFVPRSSYYNPNIGQLLEFNPIMAKELLTKAGYNELKPFPKLTIFVNAQRGGVADKWSKDLVYQLKKNLGISLQIKYCSLNEKHQAILNRRAKIWKSAWIPDYPDAEAYFRVFYGSTSKIANEESNYNNYNNFKFDSIYGLAERTKNHKKRMILHNLLDQILVQESAVVPIFSEDLFVIVNIRVRDFNISNSGIIDFSRIFIKEVT